MALAIWRKCHFDLNPRLGHNHPLLCRRCTRGKFDGISGENDTYTIYRGGDIVANDMFQRGTRRRVHCKDETGGHFRAGRSPVG